MILRFQKKNVVVLGDVILDKYIFGNVERISPEAPIPVVTVSQEKYALGGAANTANNIVQLTGSASLIGVVGEDAARDIFFEEAKKRGVDISKLVADNKRKTIQKIRVLGQHQQLLRIDYEDVVYTNDVYIEGIKKSLGKLEGFDCCIVSDYAKGIVTEELMHYVNECCLAKKIPLIVDPRPQHKKWYRGCFLVTPNKREAEAMTDIRIHTTKDLEKVGRLLCEELEAHILITTGEKGMSLFERGRDPIHVPAVAKEVYDVSGAGDTVVAVLGMAIASGYSILEASELANHAAGIKVSKLGTAPVSLAELQSFLKSQ